MEPFERVLAARRGMNVRRFHIMPVIGEASVGHHSCGVALLLIILHPDPSTNLLKVALTHDLAESWVGDVPGHTKWADLELNARIEALENRFNRQYEFVYTLSETDHTWFRVCDILDLLFFAVEQVQLGNSNFNAVVERTIEYVRNDATTPYPPICMRVFDDLIQTWRDAVL